MRLLTRFVNFPVSVQAECYSVEPFRIGYRYHRYRRREYFIVSNGRVTNYPCAGWFSGGGTGWPAGGLMFRCHTGVARLANKRGGPRRGNRRRAQVYHLETDTSLTRASRERTVEHRQAPAAIHWQCSIVCPIWLGPSRAHSHCRTGEKSWLAGGILTYCPRWASWLQREPRYQANTNILRGT